MHWIAGIFFLLFVVTPLLLWLSARVTLDRTGSHTRSTRALPVFAPDSEPDLGLGCAAQAKSRLVRIGVGELEFRARVAGFGGTGPGLILLHGFPESSIMWQPLIERAAAAGFRVVAFDQRGYSPGARPEAVSAYHASELVGDLFAVASGVGFDRFHLVGHDWGSIVGWLAAAEEPERVLSWASLSIPHPAAIPDPDRVTRRPAYISLFRIPGLAETLLGVAGRWPMRSLLDRKLSPEHRAEYDALFSEPGALTAALNWYRALPESGLPEEVKRVVEQPVLYIYGRNDIQAFVAPSVQARLPAFVKGRLESIELDAGHWLIQDEEDAVVDAVMRHLESVRS